MKSAQVISCAHTRRGRVFCVLGRWLAGKATAEAIAMSGLRWKLKNIILRATHVPGGARAAAPFRVVGSMIIGQTRRSRVVVGCSSSTLHARPVKCRRTVRRNNNITRCCNNNDMPIIITIILLKLIIVGRKFERYERKKIEYNNNNNS